jgi:hypothetical protein
MTKRTIITKKNNSITISIPQGWSDNHIEEIADKIYSGCIGLMIPYDEKRSKLIKYRIESIIYNHIKEQS